MLKPLFLFKISNFGAGYNYCGGNNHSIAVLPVKLGHIYKVHAVPTGEESKRQKNGCDDSEDSHNSILLRILQVSAKLP